MLEFGDKDWPEMIDRWWVLNPLTKAMNIGAFYVNRHQIWEDLNPQEKDFGWD